VGPYVFDSPQTSKKYSQSQVVPASGSGRVQEEGPGPAASVIPLRVRRTDSHMIIANQVSKQQQQARLQTPPRHDGSDRSSCRQQDRNLTQWR
jgi:hypothetical protein